MRGNGRGEQEIRSACRAFYSVRGMTSGDVPKRRLLLLYGNVSVRRPIAVLGAAESILLSGCAGGARAKAMLSGAQDAPLPACEGFRKGKGDVL